MDPVGAEKMCTDSPGTEEVWLKGRSWDADLKEKGQQGDEAPAKGGWSSCEGAHATSRNHLPTASNKDAAPSYLGAGTLDFEYLAAQPGVVRHRHQANNHWLGQLLPVVATPVFTAMWSRLWVCGRSEWGLWGRRSVQHDSFLHELPMGKSPSESITSLCQVLLLLHKEVKAKPLLMLEKTRRMGREGVSPLMLVSVGRDPHKQQWTFRSGSGGEQTWIPVLPNRDKTLC